MLPEVQVPSLPETRVNAKPGAAEIPRDHRAVAALFLAMLLGAIPGCRPPKVVLREDTSGVRASALHDCINLVVRSKAPGASRELLADARRCAFTHDSLQRVRMQSTASPELFRQGRIVMDIPEFHDEQRLPADTAPFLGPLVGIFTSPFLGAFRREWQIGEHPLAGVLAAHIVVDSLPGESLPQTYTRMHLAFGLNCLFLELNPPGSSEKYKAWITQPQKGEPCRPHHGNVTTPPGPPLRVIRKSIGWPQDSMVPASRIEEDSRGRPVFGVPCLEEWCRIGLPGFAEATNGFCSWPGVSCVRKEERISSWYDEQQWDEYRNGRWQSIDLRVAIVPHPAIDRFDTPAFDARQPLADLYLREDPPVGSTLWNKGVRQGRNQVYLEGPGAGGGQWQYVIVSPSGTSSTFPLAGGRPHRHFDAAIPGTTRFRYTMLDPGIWGPCGQACCPTDGFY